VNQWRRCRGTRDSGAVTTPARSPMPVAVAVRQSSDVELVDDRVAPPVRRPAGRRRLRGGSRRSAASSDTTGASRFDSALVTGATSSCAQGTRLDRQCKN
jgi:hypothetical protein